MRATLERLRLRGSTPAKAHLPLVHNACKTYAEHVFPWFVLVESGAQVFMRPHEEGGHQMGTSLGRILGLTPSVEDVVAAEADPIFPEMLRALGAQAGVPLGPFDGSGPEQDPLREAAVLRSCIHTLNSSFWHDGLAPTEANAHRAWVLLWSAWALACAEGPLTPLLRDDSVSEILLFGTGRCYLERAGRLTEIDSPFRNESSLRALLERIVGRSGRRLDDASPACDCRLADGSRVHAILPPLAIDGPALSIRKFRQEPLSAEELVASGAMTRADLDRLCALVAGRRNIVVAGATGTGKTTLLNVLSSSIPAHERIVTIEEAAELRLRQPHVVRLEAKTANVEGQGAVGVRELLRHALRMRPDRIVVGECRGGEALDMLQAMNTGHEGSLTTLHANGPVDALRRLETLVLLSGVDLPLHAVREQIASSVHAVVFLERTPEGARRVRSIARVLGLDPESGRYLVSSEDNGASRSAEGKCG